MSAWRRSAYCVGDHFVVAPEYLSKENHEGSTPVLGVDCEVAISRRIHVLAVSIILNHRDLRGPDFGRIRRFQF